LKSSRVKRLGVAAALLLLLLNGAAYAYASRTAYEATALNMPAMLDENQLSHELEFRMVALSVQGGPEGYGVGQGEANVEIQGTTLTVHVEFERMNPATHYALLLSVDGTGRVIGEMTTSREGVGDIRAVLTLDPGQHTIGLSLQDVSTFGSNRTVMQSDPATSPAMIVEATSIKSTPEHEEGAQKVSTTTANKGEEDDIMNALEHKSIPAVIHVSKTGATASLLDPNFTVSVGKYQNNGILVSISGANVTGPRVLLINLTRGASLNFSSGALLVTLDGTPVGQASSVTQVLKAQQTDPARYIILATSSGWQLLVSIPHFSLHTIAILPVVLTAIVNVVMLSAPILAVSVLVVTSIFALVYARRTRVYG